MSVTCRPSPSLSAPLPQSLPLEVWSEIVSYLPRILETHARWCQTSKQFRAISESEPLWRARLLLFIRLWKQRRSQSTLTVGTGLVGTAVDSEVTESLAHQQRYELVMAEVQRAATVAAASASLSPQPFWRYWSWKRCVVHFVFSTVRTACVICGVSLGPANVPFSLFTATRTGSLASLARRSVHEQASSADASPSDKDYLAAHSTTSTLLDFPFEGCSLCSICLRRYFLLKTSVEVRSSRAIQKYRRFFSVHRGWVVCVRQEDLRLPRHLAASFGCGGRREQNSLEDGYDACHRHAPCASPSSEADPRSRQHRRGIRLRSSHDACEPNSKGEEEDVTTTTSIATSVDAVVAKEEAAVEGHLSVRLFVAHALQAQGEKYPSAYQQSYSKVALDPMNFLGWEGHFITTE